MKSRKIIGFVLVAALLICSSARAGITAFWQQIPITPQAIANDPQLASMQCWDLMVMTSGDWINAGLRAQLPSGLFFYKHALGGLKRPSPAAIAQHPALEFTGYVNTPNDNGLNNANTLILGGFPEDLEPSIGDPTAPFPGVFEVSWGDLFPDPPGTFQIARLTFPQSFFPDVNAFSYTQQVTPASFTYIPSIPEPVAVGIPMIVGTLWLRRRLKLRHTSPSCEPLEPRSLLSFSVSFPGTAAITARTDVNASNTPLLTEGEAVIAVSSVDPLKVSTYAVDGTTGGTTTNTAWLSNDGGLRYTGSQVPLPAGQSSSGGDPGIAYDRAGNLYVVHLTGPQSNVAVAKLPHGSQTWSTTYIPANGIADKPWIMIAPNPNPGMSGQDSIYVWWGFQDVRFMRSDNGGQDFYELPNPAQGTAFADFTRMVAQPDGKRLFAVWWNRPIDVRFSWGEYDQTGQVLTWHTPAIVDTSSVSAPIPASPGRNILATASLAIDKAGKAFVTYTKYGSAGSPDTDVWVARSDDPTVPTPWIKTNLRPGNTNSQFHSFVRTDPMTGVPYVSWLDAANDPNNQNVERFMTASTDGGQTWLPSVAVSDAVSRPYVPFGYGEYNANYAFAGMCYDSWPSNQHSPTGGPMDIYTDRVILTGHVIAVTGTWGADIYHVQMNDDQNPQFVYIWENTDPVGTPDFMIHKDALAGLEFQLQEGRDVIFMTPAVINYFDTSDGFIDIGDANVIVDYPSSSPFATIQSLITSGYSGGTWSGTGIRSADADANTYGVGYAEASALFTSFPAPFAGQTVDNTTVLMKFTYYGDADLNGNVNLADFNRLAAHFGTPSGAIWSDGDFDYNGNVNLSDFNLLAANFGQILPDDDDGGSNAPQHYYTYEELLEMLLNWPHL